MTTTERIRHFHALLANVGIMDQKSAILEGYGVVSTKDLSDAQLDQVNDRLRAMQQSKNAPVSAIRRKRSAVLEQLEILGVYKARDPKKWESVNAYLLNKRICGKLLYELNETQLTTLAVKLRMIAKKQAEVIQEDNFLAANN